MASNRRHRRLRIGAIGTLAALALAACGAGAPAFGLRLQGSSSTAAYVQKVAKGGVGDDFENRTRVFERLRFDVLELGTQDLSLHGFLTSYNDVSNWNIGDTRTRLYNAYLRYRGNLAPGPDALRYEARIGRQWITAGVGSGTIDGILLHTERTGWGGLTLFGGTLGMDTREQLRLDSPDDSRRIGGELRIRPRFEGFEPEAAVSLAFTKRDDLDEYQRLGARAGLRVRRQLRLWTEMRHDFALDRTYGQAAGVEFMKSRSPLRLWAEYNRRTPSLPATSFFAFWDSRPVSELRGGFRIGIAGPYRFSFDFGRVDLKNVTTTDDSGNTRSKVDRSKTFRFALERGAVQAGLYVQSGFGGDRTGLMLRGNHDVTDKLNVRVDVDHATYDYGENVYEDNDATSGILAATYRVLPRTRVTAQVEGMSNWDLSQDVRMLLRLDQSFAAGR